MSDRAGGAMTGQIEHTRPLKARQVFIAQYFSELGSWYRHYSAGQSGEHDTSVINNIYDDFATFVLSLPANEFRIRRLWAFACQPDEISLSPGPRLSAAIADLQNGSPRDHDMFLNSLVQAAIDDAVDHELSSLDRAFISQSNRVKLEKNSGAM